MPAPGTTVLGSVIAKTLDFAEGMGLDRRTLVIGAGLEGADLTRPYLRVPFSVQLGLAQLIRTQTADPAFGIKLGASLCARDLGLLGYAMCFSATLGGALRRLVRYGDLVSEAVHFRFESPAAQHVLVVEYPFSMAAGLLHAVDSRVAGLLAVVREITGTDVVPASVAFAYDRPSSTSDYDHFFRCPLSFGASRTKLTLSVRDLKLPLLRGDEQVAGYLSDHAETALRRLTGGGTTAHAVRSAIWAAFSESRPTLPGIAAALRLPSRTLQRGLAEEGTSFTAELDHVRSQMAIALLRDPSISIEEVAFLLGYDESSSFYRSFRRWTGKTPDQYRRSATGRRSRSGGRTGTVG
jgi:AraC-like DNA-binding protein